MQSAAPRGVFMIGLLVLALAAVVCLGAALGPASLTVGEIARSLFSHLPGFAGIEPADWHASDDLILYQVRLPRVMLSALIGWSLGLAGCALQGLFRNPMADPYVIGVSSGAALGATLAIALAAWAGSEVAWSVPPAAFVGGISATFLVYGLARTGGRVPTVGLLLAGAAVSAFGGAAVSFVMTFFQEELRTTLMWLLGSLSGRGWTDLMRTLPYAAVGTALLLPLARSLNAMLTGDESAASLGVNVERVKVVTLFGAALLTASGVAAAGVIGFVGLIVPHAVRMWIGADHRYLLVASGLGGAVMLVLADIVARIVIAPSEMPVGVVTALVGAPFFLFLLRRFQRGETQ